MGPISQEGMDHVREERAGHAQVLQQLAADNGDFEARLEKADVAATYDMDDDTLEITLNGPQEAESVDFSDGLWLRVDFATNKIVGVELEQFQRHLSEKSPRLRFALRVPKAGGVQHFSARLPAVEETDVSPLQGMRELAAM